MPAMPARFGAFDAVALILACLVGLAAGTGIYTFVYAKGASYLTNDPDACANCHVMSAQFSAWMKGPHHTAAVCNDCHTPHTLVGKYYVKARNGFWHSFYFTTGGFPEPISITAMNRGVTERACLKCHRDMVHAIVAGGTGDDDDRLSCIHCHASVGHDTR
jgi:cytochrome c nitrite reductase small subunit